MELKRVVVTGLGAITPVGNSVPDVYKRQVLYAPKKRENKRLDKLTKQYQQLQLSYPTTSSWKKLSSLWRVWGVTPVSYTHLKTHTKCLFASFSSSCWEENKKAINSQ